MLLSEATLAAMVRTVGGEAFSTGRASKLRGVLEREPIEAALARSSAPTYRTLLRCSSAAVAEHELVKQSRLVRDADGTVYFVKSLAHDGAGISTLELSA